MTRGREENDSSPGVRIARVVLAETERDIGWSDDNNLFIEAGCIRVVIPRDFDQQALHNVLDVLEARRES